MPVYLYWGEEEFNIENAVNELRGQVIDPSWGSLSHKVLDEPDISELIESLETIPMAFGNLLIEVKSTSLFLRGSKKLSSNDTLMQRLIGAIENLNEKIYLLFVCQIPRDSGKKVDSVTKLVKTINKIGEVKEFSAFKAYNEDKIAKWIKDRANSKDIKIKDDAAFALIQNTGPVLRKLDLELEKLKMYVYPEINVKKEDVLKLTSGHENIFTLADLWLKNDKSLAVVELNKLFEKDHALRIIATLQTIVKKWLKIKIESQTKNRFEIASTLNQHEFVIKKDLERLKSTTVNQLIDFRQKLTEAEYKIKTGELTPEMSLELAIVM